MAAAKSYLINFSRMKTILSGAVLCCSLAAAALPMRPANKPFTNATELNYPFLPAQKMTFINGVVKNTEATALPDIEAQYSHKVRVDNFIFTLPDELCETMAACYKADLNGDKKPDYIFVNIKVWNGRFAGLSDVGIFVSNQQKKYTFNAFEAQNLEALVENGKVMLVKYSYSDDDTTFIRQCYTFDQDGKISLYDAEPFKFQYTAE